MATWCTKVCKLHVSTYLPCIVHYAELLVVFQFRCNEIIVPCFLSVALITLGSPSLGSE